MFYYCTTPTENPGNKQPTDIATLEVLKDITTFRAAIAGKILSSLTTFYYNTTSLM